MQLGRIFLGSQALLGGGAAFTWANLDLMSHHHLRPCGHSCQLGGTGAAREPKAMGPCGSAHHPPITGTTHIFSASQGPADSFCPSTPRDGAEGLSILVDNFNPDPLTSTLTLWVLPGPGTCKGSLFVNFSGCCSLPCLHCGLACPVAIVSHWHIVRMHSFRVSGTNKPSRSPEHRCRARWKLPAAGYSTGRPWLCPVLPPYSSSSFSLPSSPGSASCAHGTYLTFHLSICSWTS